MRSRKEIILSVSFVMFFMLGKAQSTVNTEQKSVKNTETDSSSLKIENHNTTRSHRRKNDPSITSRRKEKKSKH